VLVVVALVPTLQLRPQEALDNRELTDLVEVVEELATALTYLVVMAVTESLLLDTPSNNYAIF
jgi:hypothetical protein